MNSKTAKLIRKYASRTQEDKDAVRRQWLRFTHLERETFRQKMLSAIAQADKT